MPIIHLLVAELFPTDVRTVSTGLTLATSFGTSTVVVKMFPYLESLMGIGNMFFVFGVASLGVLAWGACLIPENKGLSLVKVEQKYEVKRLPTTTSAVAAATPTNHAVNA